MRSLRNVVLLFTAAVVTMTACDEFPQDPEFLAGDIAVTIEPVNWPAHVRLQEQVTLEVKVTDAKGRTILEPPVTWNDSSQGALTVTPAADGLKGAVTGVGLGDARVQVVVEGEQYRTSAQVFTLPVVLAGVGLTTSATDTSMAAIEDTITLSGFGQSASGAAVTGTNLQWRVSGDGAVEALQTTGDQISVVARAEGQDTVYVSHPACAGVCEQSVIVNVAQVADTVAVSPGSDTLVAEDTVRFAAASRDARGFDIASEVFTWTSSNTSAVTVDANGLVTADSTGSALIIATARSGKADTTAVEVLNSGVMEVQLTDAPADNLQSAVLYLGGVYVIDSQATNGRRYILDDRFQVDLLTLTDTVTVLGARRVPVGTYGNVFLQVDSARIALRSGLTFDDGTTTRLMAPPAEQADSVLASVAGSATVAEGDSVRIVIDFDVDRSFPMPNADNAGVISEVSFAPTTRTLEKTDAAWLDGTVTSTGTAGADSLTLRAVRTDIPGDTMYARTDISGLYRFRYVIPGNYTISMPAAPACHLANPASRAVSVTAGQSLTGNDFSLDPVTVTSVVADPAADTINAIGFQAQLGGTAFNGTTQLSGLSFEFAALDPSIATVDGSGMVTGQAVGAARIEVSSCGKADTAVVTVRQIAAEVTVTPALAEVEAGETAQFAATLHDSAGVAIPGASFAWSSSDEAIATVDTMGIATARRSGSADIIATHAASGVFGSGVISVAIAGTEKISMYQSLACVLTQANEVLCWGQNPDGAVGVPGSGTWQEHHPPTSIALPAAEDYVDVAAGETHACALTALGDIYCWGSGGWGELGDGLFTTSSSPVLVSRPAGVTFASVVAGSRFTCATTTANGAYCWGRGENGRLGNGSAVEQGTPTAVFQSAGVDFTRLAIGGGYNESYVCGVGTSGRAYCWGNNQWGQLGNGSEGQYEVSSPQLVTMPAGVTFTQIVTGYNTTCALGSDSGAYCWGQDTEGTIDVNNQWQTYPTPTRAGTETFASLAAGHQSVCGVKADGSVLCSGQNYYAQYGNGSTNRTSAHWSPAGGGILLTSMDGAGSTFCGVDTTGDPYCWGWKEWGLTGTGDAAWTGVALQTSMTSVIDMGKSGSLSCALTSAPTLLCWEFVGPLTGYSVGNVASPISIDLPAGETFTDVAVANYLACVLTGDGDIYCRGEALGDQFSSYGRLGDGTFNSSTNAWVKVLAPEGVTFTSLTLGVRHSCAMGSNQIPYCWGAGDNGQLGNGLYDHQGQPVAVSVPGGFTFDRIEAGWDFTCALDTAGVAFCWGANFDGELGNGTSGSTYTTPQAVQTAETFAQISAGSAHGCGVTAAGAAYCWGYGLNGQLGNNASTSSTVPVAVAGGYLFEQVVAFNRGDTSCGLEASGTVRCWGNNWNGSYGSGDFVSDDVPILGMNGLAMSVLEGSNQGTCAVDTSGAVWCTGSHEHGDTGLGIYGYESTPVRVGGSGTVGASFFAAGWRAPSNYGSPSALSLESKSGAPDRHETDVRRRTGALDRR